MPFYRCLKHCFILFIIAPSFIFILFPNTVDKSFANAFKNSRIKRTQISYTSRKTNVTKRHKSKLRVGYRPFDSKIRRQVITRSRNH